ncbi:FRG domain-containing protein [bacterium]|nr:FRG domain-containing protein [bacterium]
MIESSDYYSECDSRAVTLSDVKNNIDTINEFAQSNGYNVFWRGQANHEWGLVSSLVRKLALAAVVNNALLDRVEQALLDEASRWISDLRDQVYINPLAKLAYLQHNSIPTRLIDFTLKPWMAVFFAAESHDNVDGRIFAIMVNDTDLINVTPQGTPWRTYNTKEVKIYDPNKAGLVFPRLAAQGGVLALGRLPSTKPYRIAYDKFLDKPRSLLAGEVRRILSIPFKLSKFDPASTTSPIPARATTPIGLTFRLHVDKDSIRRDLAGMPGRNISPKSEKATHSIVYPDASGMVAHSKILQGLERGVLVL